MEDHCFFFLNKLENIDLSNNLITVLDTGIFLNLKNIKRIWIDEFQVIHHNFYLSRRPINTMDFRKLINKHQERWFDNYIDIIDSILDT